MSKPKDAQVARHLQTLVSDKTGRVPSYVRCLNLAREHWATKGRDESVEAFAVRLFGTVGDGLVNKKWRKEG